MNWDRIQTNWSQYKANVREMFGKLTDADLDATAGRRDQVLGKLQERYGYSRDVAEQKLMDFTAKMGGKATASNRDRGMTGRKTEKV